MALDPIEHGLLGAGAIAIAQPLTTLVNRSFDMVGVVYRPLSTIFESMAEAKSEMIKEIKKTELSDYKRRAKHRREFEDSMHQLNLESVLSRCAAMIGTQSTPEAIEDDWLSNFFEKAKHVSDDKMQDVWARVLAGEANRAGSFSRRTVNLLNDLDSHDAKSFASLCRFVCVLDGTAQPIIIDPEDDFLSENGVTFESLQHLESLNLIHFLPDSPGYWICPDQNEFIVSYGESHIRAWQYENSALSKLEKRKISVGCVMLTQFGVQLVPLTTLNPVNGFFDEVCTMLSNSGFEIKERTNT